MRVSAEAARRFLVARSKLEWGDLMLVTKPGLVLDIGHATYRPISASQWDE